MARPKAVLALSVALCNYHAVVGRSAWHASSEGLALEPGARPPRWQRCEPGKNDRLEPALPCRNGPFLLDTLLHYGEGFGGSLITRQQQLIYAEAIGARYLDPGSQFESNRPEGRSGPGWVLDARDPTTVDEFTGCPAGQRNARQDECLGAVVEATRNASVEVHPHLLLTDSGAAGAIPYGCSYSHSSKRAMYNSNAAGPSTPAYQLVCIADETAAAMDESDNPARRSAWKRLSTDIWDVHDGVDYTAFLGMGPDDDCDFCSLQHWTSQETAASTHLRVVDYKETDLEDICTARELGQPLPTTDPILRQFMDDPDRQNMVLRFPATKMKRFADWMLPCALSEAFTARFAEMRKARQLVPSRPDNELWMAIHLRWGDIGPSGQMGDSTTTVNSPQGRWAARIVPLRALTEQTLKVKQLLGGSRKLVVHFFSEIDEASVADFTSAVPETKLHTSASVAETLDLWSQCEISLGTRGSQFFSIASHFAPRSIILDASGAVTGNQVAGPLHGSEPADGIWVPSKRHPIVRVDTNGFSEAAWQKAAELLWGAANATAATDAAPAAGPEQRCLSLKETYGVQPGVSWGSLPRENWAEWRELSCDNRIPKS